MNKNQGVGLYDINRVRNLYHNTVEVNHDDGTTSWDYLRPLGNDSILWRIKCAWKVLLCEYDVIKWRNNQ